MIIISERKRVRGECGVYVEHAVGLCSCGNHVELRGEYYGASQCDQCGAWYGLQGESYRPPDQWEERLEDDY